MVLLIWRGVVLLVLYKGVVQQRAVYLSEFCCSGGTCVVCDMYVMDGLNEERTEFFSNGKAKRIEFNISLVKVSEDLRERLVEMEFSDLVDVLPVKL